MVKIGKLLTTGSTDSEEFEWEDMLIVLNDIIIRKNPNGNWKVNVEDFGWNKRSGQMHCFTKSASALLSKILPDTDCSFEIYNYGKGFAIKNRHHDSPCGDETYYVMPCGERTCLANMRS